jgi:hypothetical protein
VIGGYSSSNMEFKEGAKEDDNDSGTSSSISPPFLRWTGSLSTKINKKSHLARNITRSGFAAILSPECPFSAPLGNKYKALEIGCRTDGRTYAVNLHVETMFPEDMYQGFIVGGGSEEQQKIHDKRDIQILIDPSNDADTSMTSVQEGRKGLKVPALDSLDIRTHLKNRQKVAYKKDPNNHPYTGFPPLGFQKLILPFRDLALTSRGRMRVTQRDLDGAVNIESIGFTLMDGHDGDFCFDLVSLRAVNMLQGEIVGTVEEDARDEELAESFRTKIGKKKDDDEDDEKKTDSKTEKSKHVLGSTRPSD